MASSLLLALALAASPAAPQAPEAPVVEPPTAPVQSTATPTSGPLTAHPEPFDSAQGKLREALSLSKGRAESKETPFPPPPALPRKEEARAAKSPTADPMARPTPRSISPPALAEELREASRKRREELAAIQEEREKLSRLRDEIEGARKALREETAKLEERVRQAEKSAAPPAHRTPEPEPGKGPVDQLAKTVKGMKPDQAAHVVARLEKPLAVQLLGRMRPGDAAAVLERMSPEAAAEMIGLLAGSGVRR